MLLRLFIIQKSKNNTEYFMYKRSERVQGPTGPDLRSQPLRAPLGQTTFLSFHKVYCQNIN